MTTEEKLRHIGNVLRDLSLFIFESETEERKAREDRRANFKILRPDFGNTVSNCANTPPKRNQEVSQPNTIKIKGNSQNIQGEEELIKLKYGQGSIGIRYRYNKNGTTSKLYVARYWDEQGKQRYLYAKTQKEVLRKLREAHPTKKDKPFKHVYTTLKEWMSIWYNDFKKPTIRQSSRDNYEMQMNKYIFPELGKTPLVKLTAEQVQRFLNNIEAGNTKKKVHLLLSACLKKAVVLKKVQFNVCDAVEVPKYKKQKRRAFDYSEQNKILDVDKKASQVFFFLCATGLRIGEFLALTREDFYTEEHFFKVDKAIVHGIPGEPKSESSNRIVYYVDELFDYFDINLLGTFTYSGLKNAFKKILDSTGIKGVSLHSTRHTFATIMHSLGVNDKVLQSLLGHSTLAMTQDVYTHLMKKGTSKIRDYLLKLCAHLRTLV